MEFYKDLLETIIISGALLLGFSTTILIQISTSKNIVEKYKARIFYIFLFSFLLFFTGYFVAIHTFVHFFQDGDTANYTSIVYKYKELSAYSLWIGAIFFILGIFSLIFYIHNPVKIKTIIFLTIVYISIILFFVYLAIQSNHRVWIF